MTENTARQPKGIPVGGQFAPTAHAEPALNLTPRRPELDGWPEALPEPEVSFNIDDAGVVTTTVNIEGKPAFEVWNPRDDVHDIENESFENEWLEDETVHQAAQEWAHKKHDEIAWPIRREMRAAAARVRAQVLGAATGVRPAATDEQLVELVELNAATARQASKDIELASAALAARKILAAHPTAAVGDIRVDSWDNGDFISGIVVRDEDGTVLREYGEAHQDEVGAEVNSEVYNLLKNLDSNASESHWAGAFATGSYGEELYTIDLREAAAWTPGGEA